MQDALVIINVGKKCSRITVFQLDKSMMWNDLKLKLLH
jgi:hypothetical protein